MKKIRRLKIAVGADHAGFRLKKKIAAFLKTRGFAVEDEGCFSPEACDYPVFAKRAAHAVASRRCRFAILICGSGAGVCMVANKTRRVRAAVARDARTARLVRAHNNANVLCLGARFTPARRALRIVSTFLKTPFEGGRHARRVRKIE
ncbi:MAG: ribose 5-phosphate isomerase B [Candidatus Norongarragalinales archaeon]